jgi:hypothetical protein
MPEHRTPVATGYDHRSPVKDNDTREGPLNTSTGVPKLLLDSGSQIGPH